MKLATSKSYALLTAGALLLSLGCAKKKFSSNGSGSKATETSGGDSDKKDDTNDGSVTSVPTDKTVVALTEADGPKVGIRSFNQIFASMVALTGISPKTVVVVPVRNGANVTNTNIELRALYAQLQPQLPLSTDIKAFNGSAQKTIFSLAIGFCDALVAKAKTPAGSAELAKYFGGMSFTTAPAQALQGAAKDNLASSLVKAFAGPAAEDQSGQAIITELSTVIGSLMSTKAATVQSTSDIATVACAAGLASFGATSL